MVAFPQTPLFAWGTVNFVSYHTCVLSKASSGVWWEQGSLVSTDWKWKHSAAGHTWRAGLMPDQPIALHTSDPSAGEAP